MDQIFVRSFDAMLELRHFTSIILACICGLLIGYERKPEINKPVLKPTLLFV